jgi:uncharacterized protein YbjT (DUF2867 family)
MKTLVTGVTGYVGGALVPRLSASGHTVRGMARDPSRVRVEVDEVVRGDVVTGAGLDAALDGIEVAYYLVHSMEAAANGGFADQERRGAENFAQVAADAGVRRIVYLGGLLPSQAAPSPHLGSRLAVEQALLGAVPSAIAFRASIVIAARSRSFRFLVRLIERMPALLAPAWRDRRTQPIDGRDMLDLLAAAATAPDALAGSWDAVGPDVMSYAEMLDRIASHLMVDRRTIRLPFNLTPVASVVAAGVAGEDVGLIGPLMTSLEHDLLPRDDRAAEAFGVRRHSFDAAVERSLRDLEALEPVRAR